MGDQHDDVEVTGGGYRRPWALYTVVALVVMAVIAGGVATWLGGGGGGSVAAPTTPTTSAPPPSPEATPGPARQRSSGSHSPRITSCSVDLPAALVRGGHPDAAGTQEWDCDAVPYGPRAWVLRDGATGSFGHHGAVVTFPVEGPGLGTPLSRDGLRGWWSPGGVVVRLDAHYVRLRSDLGTRRLVEIVRGLRIDGSGHLRVRVPQGLELVQRKVPYRSTLVRATRYDSGDLGESKALGDGLAYVTVQEGAEFEARLYGPQPLLDPVQPAGRIHGRPAVFAEIDGSGSVAWQLDSGVVVDVGYSGAAFDRAAKRALRRLADRVQLVPPSVWENRVHLQTGQG